MRVPDPPFSHLLRLSDEVGLVEHALGVIPDQRHGYCTDDVARALVVVLREPRPPAAIRRLEGLYFRFLSRMARADGSFHNRMSSAPACRYLDTVGSDDSNGRALWALGATAARSGSAARRLEARALFARAAPGFDSAWPRANAAAALGAVDLLGAVPDDGPARDLLARAVRRLGDPSRSAAWPWPEPRLHYENARLAEARIAAGVALRDDRLLQEGLLLLEWLVDTESRGNHFSFTPHGGWAPDDARPGYDQQPIEAGAMADACARAYAATGRPYWADRCVRAAEWVLGANDAGVLLLDRESGGCRDGLERCRANANEGAESTLAMISALQQARAVQAAARSAATSALPSTIAAPT